MADFAIEQIHVVVLAAVYLEHKEIVCVKKLSNLGENSKFVKLLTTRQNKLVSKRLFLFYSFFLHPEGVPM